MARRLAHRRPQGFLIRAGGAAGPACMLFDAAGPGAAAAPDGLAGLWDGRLDNRAQLRAALGDSGPPTDAALLLAAYRRWGTACAEHFLGDFAFALWDPGRQRLLCGRDHFGVRPLCYSESGGSFVFASEQAGITAALPHLDQALNETWLADFAAGLAPTPDATVFAGISRLPAGHVAEIGPDGVDLRRYYALEARDPIVRPDAPAAFADLLRESIRCRLADDAPAGAMLSGGLDSSAIVSLAVPLRRDGGQGALPTVSLVYPDHPEQDERPFIDHVVALGGVDPIFVESGGVAPFADFQRLLHNQNGPFLGPNLAASSRLYDAAAARGLRVLLDGHGGDETVSYGAARLLDLAYTGHWLRLWREVERLCTVEQVPPLRVFAALLRRNGPHRRVRRLLGDARRRLGGPALARPPGWLRYLDPGLAARTHVVQRHAEPPIAPRLFGREEAYRHHRTVTSNIQSYAFELLDHAAAPAGIEGRFPFWDKRLVEFCLSLPACEKMADGYTRLIVRRALRGILPDAVRLRAGKLDFTPHLLRGMVNHHRAAIEFMLRQDNHALAQYFNLAELRRVWDHLRIADGTFNGRDVHAVWRAMALGLWLEERAGAARRAQG